MNISQKGIDLIKKFEGFSATPYRCPAGKMTIGYGHVVQAEREKFNAPITEADAERILRNDVKIAEKAVNELIKVPLTQEQFDALVSFTFNVGGGAFKNSTLLKKLNQKLYDEAAEELLKWKYIRV